MSADNKVPVAILGATGSVGQKFIQLLEGHPFFNIIEVAASDRSAGKTYKEAVNWFLEGPIPKEAGRLIVKKCLPDLRSKVVFSGLDSFLPLVYYLFSKYMF